MERINLHFTGDFHAITSANNLLAALIDNHLHHGNPLRLDPRRIVWRRVMDMNDRALRRVIANYRFTGRPINLDFAKEALKIHYGVKEPRNIRGISTKEEEKMLKKEGIEFMKIPMPERPEGQVLFHWFPYCCGICCDRNDCNTRKHCLQ